MLNLQVSCLLLWSLAPTCECVVKGWGTSWSGAAGRSVEGMCCCKPAICPVSCCSWRWRACMSYCCIMSCWLHWLIAIISCCCCNSRISCDCRSFGAGRLPSAAIQRCVWHKNAKPHAKKSNSFWTHANSCSGFFISGQSCHNSIIIALLSSI